LAHAEFTVVDFLGVLGGMGPLATADFLHKLALKTPAATDQEHISVLLYGDCTTPDRAANIVGRGASPLPSLLEGIRFLNRNGARAICIPCNSAHRWFAEMQAVSDVPLLHIARTTADQVRKQNPNAKVVGVLSTYVTHRMGIYRKILEEMGYEVLSPTDHEFETLISPAIAMNKANRWAEAEPLYERATMSLIDRAAEIVILGCTEIPVGMARQVRANPSTFVDSTDALVSAAISFFGAQKWRSPGKQMTPTLGAPIH
jgi:aspartate racemase